jgi:hypothetical protein
MGKRVIKGTCYECTISFCFSSFFSFLFFSNVKWTSILQNWCVCTLAYDDCLRPTGASISSKGKAVGLRKKIDFSLNWPYIHIIQWLTIHIHKKHFKSRVQPQHQSSSPSSMRSLFLSHHMCDEQPELRMIIILENTLVWIVKVTAKYINSNVN